MFNLTTRKIAKNTMSQVVGKFITMSVTVAITLLLTRLYGREAYGNFSLMQSIPALLFVVTDFGLNAVAIRHVANKPDKLYHFFVNVLVSRVFLSFILAVFMGLLLQFFPYSEDLTVGIRLGLLLVLTFGLFTSTNIVFQSLLRYDLSVIGQTAGYLVVLFLTFFLVSQRASVTWINFAYVIGGLVTFVVNFSLVRKIVPDRIFYIDFPLIKKLFKEAAPLGLMFVFSQMNFKEDALFISLFEVPDWLNMDSSSAVGVYSLPYRIFEVSLVIPTFFMNAAYPVLVRHLEEGPEHLRASFKKALLFLFGVGILSGLVGVVFAPLIVGFFGGIEFARSVEVLRILMGGVVVFYLTQPLSWLVVTLGKQKYLPWVYFISVLFNLTFNLALIPAYSFYAAAGITVCSEVLILGLLVYFSRRAWREVFFDNVA
jgi:O-antigen/teichoic acid export membrane protein